MIDNPSEHTRIHIRPMRIEDIDQVYAIDVMSFSMPWSVKSYRFELTENPTAALWVAEIEPFQRNSKIVGMIATWFIIDEVHIATIAVHPDYRRKGIGRQLLAHAILRSAGKGAKKAMLEVRRNNLGAQKLYRKFGFAVIGMRPHYYQDNNEDALLMNLDPIDTESLRQFTIQ
jgi:ribosomal-protein-alanine N-acetyltransferase